MKKEEDILKQFETLKGSKHFKVPDYYFDSIVSNVQDKIAAQNHVLLRHTVTQKKTILALSFLVVSVTFIIFFSLKVALPFWNKTSSFTNTDEVALFFEMQPNSADELILAEGMDKVPELPKIGNQEQNDTENFLLNNDVQTNDILNEL